MQSRPPKIAPNIAWQAAAVEWLAVVFEGVMVAKNLRSGVSVYWVLSYLLLLGMSALSNWVGRIEYLLWDLGLVRVSITQDVDFIHARRL